MRLVFIGTVEFSKKALEKIIELKANIVGVCTKANNTFNSDHADLIPLCIDNNIPINLTDDINSLESYEWIQSLKPDVIFCFGWSDILKKKILAIPELGVIGFHPSKLPENRGRHPLIWSLFLGLTKSASTFFFMDEGVDSGKILSQVDFKILNSDDARSLYDKVIKISLSQIEEFLPQLQNKTYILAPQNNKHSNNWRKRSEIDGLIDFRMTSEAIYNLVRALTKPYVGSHIKYKKKNITIWKVNLIKYSKNNIECGKIINIKGNIITVKTYDGAVELVEHEFQKLPKIGDYL